MGWGPAGLSTLRPFASASLHRPPPSALNTPAEALLDAPPNRPNDPLVTPTVLKHIVGQAAFQLTVLYGMLVALEDYGGGGAAAVSVAASAGAGGGGGLEAVMATLFGETGGGGGGSGSPHSHVLEMTLVFNTFVQMQLFNQFNCR
jgi:hypothetical protein